MKNRFSLIPVSPFRLDWTAMALQRRPINVIDIWDGETYSRVLLQNGRPLFIEVRQTGWTADYVLLRGLGRIGLFPGDDSGARNNLRRWLRVNAPSDYAAVNRSLMKWRPYAGLLYFYLLLDGLEKSRQLRMVPRTELQHEACEALSAATVLDTHHDLHPGPQFAVVPWSMAQKGRYHAKTFQDW